VKNRELGNCSHRIILSPEKHHSTMPSLNSSRLILALVIVLSLSGLKSATAQSDQVESLRTKVEQLQRRVSGLEARIDRLEKMLLSNKSRTREEVSTVNPNGWKNIENWRRLEKGMSKSEVRKILGRPGKVSTGALDFWYYPDVTGGEVTFDGGKVQGWQEP
jgi:hypothetical protein